MAGVSANLEVLTKAKKMEKFWIDISAEISKSSLEHELNEIVDLLSTQDCQRVEFLRGKLAVYKEMIETMDWQEKKIPNYFK